VRLDSGNAGRSACDQARKRGGQVSYLSEWGAFGRGLRVNLALYVRTARPTATAQVGGAPGGHRGRR
jgi:hypothetical protein